jgi:2Fe-2S ferredoxin
VPRVTVEPTAFTFEAKPGENLLAAALRSGARWPTVCQGAGACTTCHFVIRSGFEHFSPQGKREGEALVVVRRRYPGIAEEHVRLACQTTITGDVVVTCKGARRPS